MKVKLLAAIALFATAAAINAATYQVYKTTDNYSYYAKDNKKVGKADKVKVITYTVIDQDNFDNGSHIENEDPQRIVLIQGKDAKGLVSDDANQPKAKKFFIDPASMDAYKGDSVYEKFSMWAGDWPVAMFEVNGNSVITEFASDVQPGSFAEIGQTYVGVKKSGLVRSFKGSSLIDKGSIVSGKVEAEVYVGQKGTMKYDKKMSALTSSAKSIEEAVSEVTAYLVTKKYASTWK